MRLEDVRAACRSQMASEDDWGDGVLDQWIGEAIGFYSDLFPRRWYRDISMVTGTQSYAAPGGHSWLGLVSVEYPQGRTPAQFLRLVALSALDSSGVAVEAVSDATVASADSAALMLRFGPVVSTGETARVTYLGRHVWPVDDNDYLSVPDAHLVALTHYVAFRALSELELDEAVTVDSSNVSIVLAQLGQAARGAWLRYRQTLDRLLANESRSEIVSWRSGMDARTL